MSQLVVRHESSLMRVARHWSLCREDALDAYQRALEIYVRRLDSLDPSTEIAWLKVVEYRNLGTRQVGAAHHQRPRQIERRFSARAPQRGAARTVQLLDGRMRPPHRHCA